MAAGGHALYRWERRAKPKRREQSSRYRTSASDVQAWIKNVELAADRALNEASDFTDNPQHGMATAKQVDDPALAEARKVLSSYMASCGDPATEVRFADESWMKPSAYTKHVDQLLVKSSAYTGDVSSATMATRANISGSFTNMASAPEFAQPLGVGHIDSSAIPDEDVQVDEVIRQMMQVPIEEMAVQESRRLGNRPAYNPQLVMNARHQEVKRRQAERENFRKMKAEKEQMKKAAEKLLAEEEAQQQASLSVEKMLIKNEMELLRREIRQQTKEAQDALAQELAEQRAQAAAKEQECAKALQAEVAALASVRTESRRAAAARQHTKRVLLAQLQETVEQEERDKLRLLHRTFSVWFSLVIERRQRLGQARAVLDWQQMLHSWQRWLRMFQKRQAERKKAELGAHLRWQRHAEEAAVHLHTCHLLRKCFRAWRRFVHHKRLGLFNEDDQLSQHTRMDALLGALVSGKLNPKDVPSREVSSKQISVLTPKRNATRKQAAGPGYVNSSLFEQGSKQTLLPSTKVKSFKTDKSVLQIHQDVSESVSAASQTSKPDFQKPSFSLAPQFNQQRTVQSSFPASLKEQLNMKRSKQQERPARGRLTVQGKSNSTEAFETDKLGNASEGQESRIHSRTVDTDRPQTHCGSSKVDSSLTVLKNPNKTFQADANIKDEQVVRQYSVTSATSAEKKGFARAPSSREKVYQPPPKPAIISAMEARAAEMAERKRAREQRRREAGERARAELRQLEEERQQQEEAEKRALLEKKQEERRLARLREKEKQERLERFAAANARADEHRRKTLLKYCGLLPWRRFITSLREQQRCAMDYSEQRMVTNAFRQWIDVTKIQQETREKQADEVYSSNLLQRSFYKWSKALRCYYAGMQLAQEHSDFMALKHCFAAWFGYSRLVQRSLWEKERRAIRHHSRATKRAILLRWQRFVPMCKEERAQERRRDTLRMKVSQWLPDFQASRTPGEQL